MGHREDLTRGVFIGPCERCGQICPCRLRMVDNGYLWVCVDGCEPTPRNLSGSSQHEGV